MKKPQNLLILTVLIFTLHSSLSWLAYFFPWILLGIFAALAIGCFWLLKQLAWLAEEDQIRDQDAFGSASATNNHNK